MQLILTCQLQRMMYRHCQDSWWQTESPTGPLPVAPLPWLSLATPGDNYTATTCQWKTQQQQLNTHTHTQHMYTHTHACMHTHTYIHTRTHAYYTNTNIFTSGSYLNMVTSTMAALSSDPNNLDINDGRAERCEGKFGISIASALP